jgi:hypothetical protein
MSCLDPRKSKSTIRHHNSRMGGNNERNLKQLLKAELPIPIDRLEDALGKFKDPKENVRVGKLGDDL